GSVPRNDSEGTDLTVFKAGSTKIGGALNMTHGDGFCAVSLNFLTTDEFTAGSIAINGGGALTNVSAGGAKLAVNGPMTISGGSGQTSLVSTTTTFNGNLSDTRKHSAFLTLGAFGASVVGKGATFNLGAGPASLALGADSNLFTGNVSILGGEGISNVQLANLNVAGNLAINNGSGDNTITFTAGNSK